MTFIADVGTRWPVALLGAAATLTLVITLAFGRPEPVVGVLALLGAAYVVILVADVPALDARAAIVGAILLATGELAYASVEARVGGHRDAEVVLGRVGWIAASTLVALLVGGVVIAVVDLLGTGGLAVEALGAAAAVGAVGVLVAAARTTRR